MSALDIRKLACLIVALDMQTAAGLKLLDNWLGGDGRAKALATGKRFICGFVPPEYPPPRITVHGVDSVPELCRMLIILAKKAKPYADEVVSASHLGTFVQCNFALSNDVQAVVDEALDELEQAELAEMPTSGGDMEPPGPKVTGTPSFEPGTVQVVTVAHEPDCQKPQGGECTCDPDIHYGEPS